MQAGIVQLVLMTVLLAGCQALPFSWDQPNYDQLAWMAPSAFGAPVQINLLFRFTSAQGEFEAPAVLEVTQDRVSLVGFSHIGGVLFVQQWREGQLTLNEKLLPQPLQKGNLLHEVQLALWPLTSLEQNAGDSYEFSQTGVARKVLHRGHETAIVSYTDPGRLTGKVTFNSSTQHYHWSLEILQTEQLDTRKP